MPYKLLMTWIPARSGWYKKYKGKLYQVSTRQLGASPTKQDSWRDANRWWDAKKIEIDAQARVARDVDPRAAYRSAVATMAALREYERTGALPAKIGVDLGQREVVFSLDEVGKQADALGRRAMAALDAVLEVPDPDRTVRSRAEAWYETLISSLNARTMSVGRFGSYRRNLNEFVAWIGANAAIEAIDSRKLEAWYAELSGRVAAGTTSPDYARNLFGATKMFISWLSEHGLMTLPGNLSNRRFKFGKGKRVTRADLFTPEEIGVVLAAAVTRLRLFLLLMLNTGMYQGDISDLGEDEVDWEGRKITRARSKTGGQVVQYRLWPETFELLKECRHVGGPVLNERGSPRVLLTTEGKPLTAYWLEDGKERRYDTVQSLYSRLKRETGIRKPLKSLRNTAASELAKDPSSKFYVQYFLGHSPRSVAEQHYLVPSDEEFFAALDWLRVQLGLSGEK